MQTLIPQPATATVIAIMLLSMACPAQQTAVFTGPRAFSALARHLRSRVRVPVLLPTYVPFDDDSDPVFLIVEEGSPQGYTVELAYTRDCEGAHFCHLGEVTGSSKPLPRDRSRNAHSVRLGRGMPGRFVAAGCGGAGCDDAELSWSERGYFYAVSIKGGRLTDLRKFAAAMHSNDGNSKGAR